MKYCFVFVSLFVLLISCSDKDKLPPDIYPINKMKLIVWDMEMADQTATDNFLMKKDSLRMEATSLYQHVFTKYKTNKKAFYNSFDYYEAHPVLLKTLLDSVSRYGARQKETIYKSAY